MKPFQ